MRKMTVLTLTLAALFILNSTFAFADDNDGKVLNKAIEMAVKNADGDSWWHESQNIAEKFEIGKTDAERQAALKFLRELESNDEKGWIRFQIRATTKFNKMVSKKIGHNPSEKEVKAFIKGISAFLPRYIDKYHGNGDGFLQYSEHIRRAALLEGESLMLQAFYLKAKKLQAY